MSTQHPADLPPILVLGREYPTLDGQVIKLVSISNAGTEYETMADEQGRHRYSRNHSRIIGRLTGSPIDAPGNIAFSIALAQAQPSLTDERAAFEAWFKPHAKKVHLERCGETYFGDWAACAWEGWQARAAIATQAAQPENIGTLRRDLARAHDSANDLIFQNKMLQQEVRELKAFRAMANRYRPEFPADPDGPRDVWYWQGDHMDHLESMTHTLPIVIRAEQLRELLAAKPVQAQRVPREWRSALRKLAFMARTSGGTAGPDSGLMVALLEAEELLSQPYLLAAAPQAALQAPEPTTWSRYVAGMIGAYLGWPVDDDRIEAVAGIIERRRWAQEKALETPSKLTEEQHVAAVKVLLRANGLDGLPQRMLDAMLAAAPTPTPETCSNCDTPAPGCEGLFASEGKACKFHGVEGTKP